MGKKARQRAAKGGRNGNPEMPVAGESPADVAAAFEKAQKQREQEQREDRIKAEEERKAAEDLLHREIAVLLQDVADLEGSTEGMDEDDLRTLEALKSEAHNKLRERGIDPEHPEKSFYPEPQKTVEVEPVAPGSPQDSARPNNDRPANNAGPAKAAPQETNAGADLNNQNVRNRLAWQKRIKELEAGSEEEQADARVLRNYLLSDDFREPRGDARRIIQKYNRDVFEEADKMQRSGGTPTLDAVAPLTKKKHVSTKSNWDQKWFDRLNEKNRKLQQTPDQKADVEIADAAIDSRIPAYIEEIRATDPHAAEALQRILDTRHISGDDSYIGPRVAKRDGTPGEEPEMSEEYVAYEQAKHAIRDKLLAERAQQDENIQRFSGQFEEGFGAEPEEWSEKVASRQEGVDILSTKEIMDMLEVKNLNIYDAEGNRRPGYKIEKIYQRNGIRLAQLTTFDQGGLALIPLDELLEANDIDQPKLAGINSPEALKVLTQEAEKEHVGPIIRDFFENDRKFSEQTPEVRKILAEVYRLAYNAEPPKRPVRALIPENSGPEGTSVPKAEETKTPGASGAATEREVPPGYRRGVAGAYRSYEEIMAASEGRPWYQSIKEMGSKASKIALGIAARAGTGYALKELTGVTGIPSAIDIVKYAWQKGQLNGPSGLANAMTELVLIERNGKLSDRAEQRKKFNETHGKEFKELISLENQYKNNPDSARPLTKEESKRLYELKALRSPTSARFAEIEKKLGITRGGGNQRGSDQRRLIAQQLWEMRSQTDHTEAMLRTNAKELVSQYLETKVNGVQAARATLNVALLTAATQTGIPWIAKSKLLSSVVPYLGNSRVLSNGIFDLYQRKHDAELAARIHNKVGEKIVAPKNEKRDFQEHPEQVLWRQAMGAALRDNVGVFFKKAEKHVDPAEAQKNKQALNSKRWKALFNISSYVLTAGGSQYVARLARGTVLAAEDFYQHHFGSLKDTFNPGDLDREVNHALGTTHHKVVHLRENPSARISNSGGKEHEMPVNGTGRIKVTRGATESVQGASNAVRLAEQAGQTPLRTDLLGEAAKHPVEATPEPDPVREVALPSTHASIDEKDSGVSAEQVQQATTQLRVDKDELDRMVKEVVGKVPEVHSSSEALSYIEKQTNIASLQEAVKPRNIWSDAGREVSARLRSQLDHVAEASGGRDSATFRQIVLQNQTRLSNLVEANPARYGLPEGSVATQMTAEQIKSVKWDLAFRDAYGENPVVEVGNASVLQGALSENPKVGTFFEKNSDVPITWRNIEAVISGKEQDLLSAAHEHIDAPVLTQVTTSENGEKLLAPEVGPGAAQEAAVNSEALRKEVRRALGGGRDDYMRLMRKVGARNDHELVLGMKKFMEERSVKDPVEALRKMSRASGLERLTESVRPIEEVHAPTTAESIAVATPKSSIEGMPEESKEIFTFSNGEGRFVWAKPEDVTAATEVHDLKAPDGTVSHHVVIKGNMEPEVTPDKTVIIQQAEVFNDARISQLADKFFEKFSPEQQKAAFEWARHVQDHGLYPGASSEKEVDGVYTRVAMEPNGTYVSQVGSAIERHKVPPKEILNDPYFKQVFLKPIDQNAQERRGFFERAFDIKNPGDRKVISQNLISMKAEKEEVSVDANGTIVDKTEHGTDRWPIPRSRFTESGKLQGGSRDDSSGYEPNAWKRFMRIQKSVTGKNFPGVKVVDGASEAPHIKAESLSQPEQVGTHAEQPVEKSGSGRIIVTKRISPSSVREGQDVAHTSVAPERHASTLRETVSEPFEGRLTPEELTTAAEHFKEKFGEDKLAELSRWRDQLQTNQLRPGMFLSSNGLNIKVDQDATVHTQLGASSPENVIHGPTQAMLKEPFVQDMLRKMDGEYQRDFFATLKRHNVGSTGVDPSDKKSFLDKNGNFHENLPGGEKLWPNPEVVSLESILNGY